MQPPSHDEIEAVTPVLSALLTLAKWVGGPAAVAWIAGRFLIRNSVKAGETKRRYEELVEDVEAIKLREQLYITVTQHEAMQLICTTRMDGLINTRIQQALAGIHSDMSKMNGNICKIMGAMNIPQDSDGSQRRRSTDTTIL